jgi:hypothetical protein
MPRFQVIDGDVRRVKGIERRLGRIARLVAALGRTGIDLKVMVGGAMAALGLVGLAILLVYSPYRLVIVGVLSICMLTTGWQLLMAKVGPQRRAHEQIIRHYHHRRFF